VVAFHCRWKRHSLRNIPSYLSSTEIELAKSRPIVEDHVPKEHVQFSSPLGVGDTRNWPYVGLRMCQYPMDPYGPMARGWTSTNNTLWLIGILQTIDPVYKAGKGIDSGALPIWSHPILFFLGYILGIYPIWWWILAKFVSGDDCS